MIKGIIFDIGGVLAYDIKEYLFEFENCALVERYQLNPKKVKSVSDALWEKYAYTDRDYSSTWEILEKKFWEEFKQELNLHIPTDELISLSEKFVRPVPGMIEFLNWSKKQNYDLLICSNNCEFFFQRQKRKVGLDKYFSEESIILSNRFGVSKSDSGFMMFRAVEQRMEHPKETYLFIDDRTVNIKAALNFGITPLLFPAEKNYGAEYIKNIINQINSYKPL